MNSTTKIMPTPLNECVEIESAFVPRITDGATLQMQESPLEFDGITCEDLEECPVLVSPDKMSKRLFAERHERSMSQRMADNIAEFKFYYRDAISKYNASKK